MIYGATGYTGRLIVQEAVARGHKPILAGRNAESLRALAAPHGLETCAVNLDDSATLNRAVADVDLVLHCAGPFTATSKPMLRACLSGKTHYLDITGELRVFENVFLFDQPAREQKIALIPGVGFDVIPTNCLAQYVADAIKDPVELEIAIATRAFGSPTAGTSQSMMELIAEGGVERRDGRLASLPLGQGVKRVQFPYGERDVMAIPWGDLSTSYRSTRIPNITTYFRYDPGSARLIRMFGFIAQGIISITPIRRMVQAYIDRTAKGPSEQARETGRAYLWARAADLYGNSKEAWMETIEAYEFTKLATVRAVERVLETQPVGALAPAQAFGADFALEISGTRRMDSVE